MDEFRACFSRRFGEKPRTVHIYRSRSIGILLAVVDLQHCAIEDQRRLRSPDTAVDRNGVGDIEIGVFKRHDFMVARHSPREMAAHKSGGAGYQHFHSQGV